MDCKEKAIVYPFDIEFMPLIRYRQLIENYEIVDLVSPKGWGFIGKDAGCVDNSDHVGIEINSSFDEALTKCDTVIFTQSYMYLDFEKSILPKINKAIDNKKNIVCNISISDEIHNYLLKKCNDEGCYFKYYAPLECNRIYNDINIDIKDEKIFEIDTPIILVMGMTERNHKLNIQLSIRKNLIDMGYKISQIGSRHYCELLGFNSFPNFMGNNNISESNKIVLFNHYIKRIEEEEQPDVIVIGVPGGAMTYNNLFTNRFGILAYEVSQAIQPDATVISTLYEDYEPKYFEMISESFKYKFGFEIDCYNLSSVKLMRDELQEVHEVTFATIDPSIIDIKKRDFNSLSTPVYNILNYKDADEMTSFLIKKLQQYGETECI